MKLILIFTFIITVTQSRLFTVNYCNRHKLPSLQSLRSDQFTVLINGYSESRIPLLTTVTGIYSSSPSSAAVVILWGNPNTPSKTLLDLSHNLTRSSPGHAPITVVRQPSDSLNARFLPRAWITTRAVVICDDDVEIDPKTIEFAFKMFLNNKEKLVGLFVRSHEFDLMTRGWIYTVHPDRYSILLTKFMLMSSEYLYKYSCEGGELMAKARLIVDEMRNCEDVLMNFVVANETNVGPVLVGGNRVRDWGDARNDGGGVVGAVGLSSRKKDHRKRRGECIQEFHRVFGKMPLRYSYGKVVDSVGEQGLCKKRGKLVFCDRFA
ncbi:glycosyltransferase family protein 64 C3 [Tanacetum coccineum]